MNNRDFRIAASREHRQVAMIFGDVQQPEHVVTFTPEQAREIAAALTRQADVAEGIADAPAVRVATLSRQVS